MANRRSKSNWRAMRPAVMQLEARRLLAITAAWVHQSAAGDYVGPEAGAGPDGTYDDVIHVTGINTTGVQLNDFDVIDGSFLNASTHAGEGQWETQHASRPGGNLGGYAPAWFQFTPTDHTQADIYINPYIYIKNPVANSFSDHAIAAGDQLTVTANYTVSGSQQIASESSTTTVGTPPNSLPPVSSTVAARDTRYTLNQVGFIKWTQNAGNVAYPGWVNVTLSGINYSRIAGAVLSDPAGISWGHGTTTKVSIDTSNPLVLPSQASPTTLSFPPLRNEQDASMSLTIYYNDGSVPSVTEFKAGFSDPSLTAPTGNNVVDSLTPSGDASGGTDLNNLAAALGTRDGVIQLGPAANSQAGQYYLDGPIKLSRPVTIQAQPGATITVTFLNGSSSPWSDAIDINSDQVTLNGFRVNFSGNSTWSSVQYPPAVISDLDFVHGSGGVFYGTSYAKKVLIGITIENMQITGPPALPAGRRAQGQSEHDQSPGAPQFYQTGINGADGTATGLVLDASLNLTTLYSVVDGRIDNNILSGGTVAFNGGPWNIDNNDDQGAVPGMVTETAFSVYFNANDTTISSNHVHQVNSGNDVGRLYKFFGISGQNTNRSFNTTLEGNRIDGNVGLLAQDLQTRAADSQGDLVAASSRANFSEITLFEEYDSGFEGKPLYVSDGSNNDPFGGRLLVVPTSGVSIGNVVSILSGRDNGHVADAGASGNQAGQWRLVEQVLLTTPTYDVILVNQPMPRDPQPRYGYVISINPGHVNPLIENNIYDLTGTNSTGVVLTGNDFNARLVGNTFIGGDVLEQYNQSIAEGKAFDIRSTPTNRPGVITYAPTLGTIIDDNIIQGSLGGGSIQLEHGNDTVGVADRTYITATVTRNTWRWDSNFVTAGTPFLNPVPPTSSYSPTVAAQQSYPYPSSFNSDQANHGAIGSMPQAGNSFDFPLLKTLTIGYYNTAITNNQNETRATENWTLAPSWTVGQSANGLGYYEDDNLDYDQRKGGFVDPLEEVVSIQANSYQILDPTSKLPIANYNFPANYGPPKTIIVAGYVNASTLSTPAQPVDYDTSLIPAADARSRFIAAGSPNGHDGFLADYGFSGGQTGTYATQHAIDTSGVLNPAPQSVYQSERYAMGASFTYTLNGLMPNASYTVRLDFSENFMTGPNQRQFDVSIDGITVLSHFDIFARVGAEFKADAEYFAATAMADGTISIGFNSDANMNNAKVDGIEIRPATAVEVGQDGSDFVGGTYPNNLAPPDGLVDEHVALSNLLNLPIDYIIVSPYGGGGAVYTGLSTTYHSNMGLAKAILSRAAGSTSADLYFEASHGEIGVDAAGINPDEYNITVKYLGTSTTQNFNIRGVFNDPNLVHTASTTKPKRSSPFPIPAPAIRRS